jgi:glutamine amidotransferase-like uncharacterized protein
MLFTVGLKSQILGPTELKANVTPNDMLVIGGGIPNSDGEWTIKQDLVKVNAFEWLKSFISSGGRYVGICAGAYLTEEWIDKTLGESGKGLNIFPGKIDNYSKRSKTTKFLLTEWPDTNTKRWVYFQDGPAFYPDQNSNVKVLATFTADETPAAVIFNHGNGKVGLISPHLEADEDWAKMYKLIDKDGIDYSYGISIFKQVLE